MNWNEYWQIHEDSNVEENNIYTESVLEFNEIRDENEGNQFVHETRPFETDKVFNSRQELINWVQTEGRKINHVIIIKRSNTKNILFKCNRCGIPISIATTRKRVSKKCGCPFELEGKKFSEGDFWGLNVICDKHNHEPVLFMEGHAYARRLSESEVEVVKDLSTKNVKPRHILSTLKNQNPENVSTKKTIYNVRQKFRIMERGGKTQMQVVMSILEKEGYIFYVNANPLTNKLEELFFTHPKSLEIWRAFPHVLLMDATYNIGYAMPLLEIVGLTSTNKTFCIAFIVMHKEKKANYRWALDCLKSTMDGCVFPRVIVTNRELALMNACDDVFPDAKRLLCRWHINRVVVRKCKRKLSKSWPTFYKAWGILIASQTKEAYMTNLAHVEEILSNYPSVIDYLHNVWLIPYKEMFVHAWINNIINFGQHTTNRVESQHALLKLHLDSSQSDLVTSVLFIHKVVELQFTGIKERIEESRIMTQNEYNIPLFRKLSCSVSLHALRLIFKEFENFKESGFCSQNCKCQLRLIYGLPCAHEQEVFLNQGCPIPLDSVDKFWRKLDLSPCTSLEDNDINCEVELEMFNAHFKKQSRSGKSSFLRKLKEIFIPSTTSVREPVRQPVREPKAHNTTHRHSSFRKTNVEPPPEAEETRRRSCSSIYENQRYFSHPLMNQIPNFFHPYVTQIHNVIGDENCGFRSVAAWLGLHEESWPQIRLELIHELVMHKVEYTNVFGDQDVQRLQSSIKQDGHWMIMPKTGLIIASRYNMAVLNLSKNGSTTCFPLWSSPPESQQQYICAIAHVYDNHYVKVVLNGYYPIPPAHALWIRYRYDSTWEHPYMNQQNLYNQLIRSNYNSAYVNLGD